MASNRKDGYEVTVVGKGKFYFTSYGSMIRFVDHVGIGQFSYRDGILVYPEGYPTYDIYAMSEDDLTLNAITFKEKGFNYGKNKNR